MKEILRNLSQGKSLSEEQSYFAFAALLGASEVSDAQIGAFLSFLAARDVTVDELVGAARSMREHMICVDGCSLAANEDILDTCGTGGSGLNAFNTSTVSAFIAVAAGQKVAKHGNRAVTGKCGSADLLESLGINTSLSPQGEAKSLAETSFCFCFAPQHHPATKRVGAIRKELGFRTIFNFLGPLSNPAKAQCQLIGVSSAKMVEPIAYTLARLGTKHSMVVCGADGLDEISLCNETMVAEVFNAQVKTYRLCPEDFGFSRVEAKSIEGAEPEKMKELVISVLEGNVSPYRDLVLLNAGAALYVSNKSMSIKEGISFASSLLDSGKALAALDKIREFK